MAPAAGHETVGADRELHVRQVLLELSLTEADTETILAHVELLRAARIEAPIHHLCLGLRRAAHVAHDDGIRAQLDAVAERHRPATALPRCLELAAFQREFLAERARINRPPRLVVDRAGLHVAPALVPAVGVLQHRMQDAVGAEPRRRSQLAVPEDHHALLVVGGCAERHRRRSTCRRQCSTHREHGYSNSYIFHLQLSQLSGVMLALVRTSPPRRDFRTDHPADAIPSWKRHYDTTSPHGATQKSVTPPLLLHQWGQPPLNTLEIDNPLEVICAFTVSNASIFTNHLPNARRKRIGKDVRSRSAT